MNICRYVRKKKTIANQYKIHVTFKVCAPVSQLIGYFRGVYRLLPVGGDWGWAD